MRSSQLRAFCEENLDGKKDKSQLVGNTVFPGGGGGVVVDYFLAM